jgi:LPS O-antigen subunit length determinant protein (WzzB/FepE family)
MADAPRFDLIDIVRTLRRRIRFILLFSIAAAIIGALFYFLQEKTYKATSEFFVSNPNYADRNNLFRTNSTQFINYFGSEDDIDKVMAIANSANLKTNVIYKTNLATAYKLDTAKVAERNKLFALFKDGYDVKRTEYQNMEVSFVDTDPKMAAYVTNEAVKEIERTYSGYFNVLRGNIQRSLQAKVVELDSSISRLTDSLIILRNRYGIFDIISPSRETIISTSGHGSSAEGIEVIQNIESIKDQFVIERVKYLALVYEFSTGTNAGALPLLNVISHASAPTVPKGLGPGLTILACFLVGLFFAAMWVLIAAYYRALMAVSRD